jgi:hypothetical protein
MKVQKLSKTVERYTNNVKKLIKRIDSENRWSEDEKVWHFLKGLRKDVAYQARPLILSQENSTLEMAIRIARQFEENAQTYPETAVRYGVVAPAEMQGLVSTCNRDNEKEDKIEQIVQKALVPITETLQKIMEKENRMTNAYHRRPNYNNENREHNTRNRNNANDPFSCYTCSQTRHMSQGCPMRPGYQRNPNSFPIQEPNRTQINSITNQPTPQAPQNNTNGSTFITQEEEVGQPAVTDWKELQHLNW